MKQLFIHHIQLSNISNNSGNPPQATEIHRSKVRYEIWQNQVAISAPVVELKHWRKAVQTWPDVFDNDLDAGAVPDEFLCCSDNSVILNWRERTRTVDNNAARPTRSDTCAVCIHTAELQVTRISTMLQQKHLGLLN